MSDIIKDLKKVEEYMISDGDYHDHSFIVHRAIEEIERLNHGMRVLEARLISPKERMDPKLWIC